MHSTRRVLPGNKDVWQIFRPKRQNYEVDERLATKQSKYHEGGESQIWLRWIKIFCLVDIKVGSWSDQWNHVSVDTS